MASQTRAGTDQRADRPGGDFPRRYAVYGTREVVVDEGEGGHGGGDALLLSDLFRGPGDHPLHRQASYVDGLRSVAVGVGATISLAEGRPVPLAELGVGLEAP